jgi:hypothetical protein
MNPRRVHELMRERFPRFSHVDLNWQLLCRESQDDAAQVLRYLREHFAEEELLVEVTRKSGGLHKLEDASAIIASAAGSSEIRIANRAFTSFAVVGIPGVVAAWHSADTGNV